MISSLYWTSAIMLILTYLYMKLVPRSYVSQGRAMSVVLVHVVSGLVVIITMAIRLIELV